MLASVKLYHLSPVSELAMPITHTVSQLLSGIVGSLQLSGLAYSTVDNRALFTLCIMSLVMSCHENK
jgi:hypothetical protein